MTKKEFKSFVEEALDWSAAWFKTNDDFIGGVLYVEDNEFVFNFIDGDEDFRYEIDEEDMKSIINQMWKEQEPKTWEQIDEEEYEELDA